MSNGDSFVLSDEELQKIIDDALGSAPPIDDMPVSDQIIQGPDGLFYFVYTLEAQDIDGLNSDVTVYYTDTSNYKQNFTRASVDELKASGISFGSLAEVDSRLKGRNPIHLLLDDLQDELKLNDYLLKAAESDGNFAAVGVFLESLFEGKPASYVDYAVVSPYINALSGDQLTYFQAMALGEDPAASWLTYLVIGLGFIVGGEAKSSTMNLKSTEVSGYRALGMLGINFGRWEVLGGYQYSVFEYKNFSTTKNLSLSGGLMVFGIGMGF